MYRLMAAVLLMSSSALASPPTEGWIGLRDASSGDQTGYYKYEESTTEGDGSVHHRYRWEPPANIASGESVTVTLKESWDGYGTSTIEMIGNDDREWFPATQDENGDVGPMSPGQSQ